MLELKAYGTLRYATSSYMVHLAVEPDGCGWIARCGAYVTAGSGGMPIKVCKRCVSREDLAIAKALVAFVAWAASFAQHDYFGTCDKTARLH